MTMAIFNCDDGNEYIRLEEYQALRAEVESLRGECRLAEETLKAYRNEPAAPQPPSRLERKLDKALADARKDLALYRKLVVTLRRLVSRSGMPWSEREPDPESVVGMALWSLPESPNK
jgi:hypothetical protein